MATSCLVFHRLQIVSDTNSQNIDDLLCFASKSFLSGPFYSSACIFRRTSTHIQFIQADQSRSGTNILCSLFHIVSGFRLIQAMEHLSAHPRCEFMAYESWSYLVSVRNRDKVDPSSTVPHTLAVVILVRVAIREDCEESGNAGIRSS